MVVSVMDDGVPSLLIQLTQKMAKIEEITDNNDDSVEQFENVDEVIDASGLRHKLRHHPQLDVPNDLEIGEVFGAILYIIPFR